MGHNRIDLAKYRLERAKEDLRGAIENLNKRELKFSANRAYYSIYHSIRTILALEQKDFKKHSAVISYFNLHYIKTGVFPSNLFKLISDASLVRNASDYDDFYIASFDKTNEQVESAKLIFGLVEKHINNLNDAGE